MPTAEEHNRRQGAGLVVLVMDQLRRLHATGQEATLWSLNRDLCERYRINGRPRVHMYNRVRTVVKNLEMAGLVHCTNRWEPDNNRYTKLIVPCSVQ